MKTIALLSLVLLCAGVVNAAIPSAAECKEARAKLAELTADDYKALKAKKMSHEQVGDALAQYADNEESAAGKFALLQDAFQQYVTGKSVEKADGVYSKAQTIGGMEYAIELVRPSKLKLSGYATSKFPAAKLLKDRIAADEKSFQRVAIVKAQLKKSPGDEKLCEQLGVEYAACGDWQSALAAFVTAPGEIAKIADWELNGGKGADYTAATAGAFWWKFADNFPKRKNVEETMKLHAAIWYKLALDKDAFKGNEKTIIEKRIAETEKFGAAAQAEKELAAKKMATLDPIKLEFSKDCVVELIGCPAGEFMMGKKGDDDPNSPTRYHKVKITRPFWMSKFKVTHRVSNRCNKYSLNAQDEILGMWNRIHEFNPRTAAEFFVWLNKCSSFKKLIPKGYVFRLPTEAEWEYAVIANAEDPNDPYVQFRGGILQNRSSLIVSFDDALARDKKGILPRGANAFTHLWGMEAGTKTPNAWGFHDMIGSGGDLVLDICGNNGLQYDAEETDPLRFVSGDGVRFVKRCPDPGYTDYWAPSLYRKEPMGESLRTAIHIVIGPDLMKEKGYTAKAKKR